MSSDAQTSYPAPVTRAKLTALCSAVLHKEPRPSTTLQMSQHPRTGAASAHVRDSNGKHTWTFSVSGLSPWRESLFRYFLLLESCSLKLPPSLCLLLSKSEGMSGQILQGVLALPLFKPLSSRSGEDFPSNALGSFLFLNAPRRNLHANRRMTARYCLCALLHVGGNQPSIMHHLGLQ